MSVHVPDRSLDQRMAALGRANEIRTYRACGKRDLAAGRRRLADVLADEMFSTAKLIDVLLACPAVGRAKAHRVLRDARISPSKAVGAMTARQRQDLWCALDRYPAVARATMPASCGS